MFVHMKHLHMQSEFISDFLTIKYLRLKMKLGGAPHAGPFQWGSCY